MALEVEIEKRAGDFHLQTAFTCGQELLGILGASGCGKSMTLKCIAGIEKPDRGRIVLDGRVLFDSDRGISLSPQKRRVGCLFQNYALFPNRNVRQNILCGLQWEKDRARRENEAGRVIEMLGLSECEKLYPAQLSGGQAQRTALGRILVNRPEILMLDEPFSALDMHLRLKLQMELLNLLKDFGKPVLMVTHDRDEAFRMCRRLGVMERGRMLTVKDTRELFADPESRAAAAITGCKNISAAVKTGEHEVFVPSWNLHLCTDRPVGDHLTAVGIRAHHFSPSETRNRFRMKVIREMEEPFEWVSEFRMEGQQTDSPAVWWRYARELRPDTMPEYLGTSPESIMLLYG